jgi:hypothetical protein
MARTQKSTKAKLKWIDADDVIFTADHQQFLAFAFLRGHSIYPDGSIRFFRRDSPEESRAREALLQTLRADVLPYSESVSSAQLSPRQITRVQEVTLLLQEFARLFDERKNPFVQRKLVLKERGRGRQPYRDRDRRVAELIARELHAGRDMESSVAKAMELCGGSRDYIFRVWKTRGEDAKKYLGALSRPAVASMEAR